MLHIIEAGAEAEILAEAEDELDNASVGLDVRLEDVILGHLALPVPGGSGLRIRIHFIRIRIQHFRLNFQYGSRALMTKN
jgi:hypothetical protein